MKSIRPYQTLPVNFTELGFQFRQVARQGMVAAYERRKIGLKRAAPHFEVIRIQFAKANTFPNGRSYPDREVYPWSELWGEQAWTCQNLKRAMALFEEMCSAESAQ